MTARKKWKGISKRLVFCLSHRSSFAVAPIAACLCLFVRYQTTDYTFRMDDDSLQKSYAPLQNFNGLCASIRSDTTVSLWSSNLKSVFEHSLPDVYNNTLSKKSQDTYFNFMLELLHIMQSDRLLLSLGNLPRADWQAVERVMTAVYKRWRFVNALDDSNSNDNKPGKVKVLVMGGSVTAGVRCTQILENTNKRFFKNIDTHKDCSWPHRLEGFLNRIFGGDVFSIYNAATRGQDSRVGAVLLQFDLLPQSFPSPDIIINSYSTNDAKGQTRLEIIDGIEAFVRRVMGECRDRRPLLIHFDDYLGTEHDSVMETSTLSQVVSSLADYYGFTTVSYAAAVRDLIIGSPEEKWLSPTGYCDKTRSCKEIHPQLGMHIVSSWIMAFNLLHLATTFCSLKSSLLLHKTVTAETIGRQFRADGATFPGKPLAAPEGLQPKFTTDSSVLKAKSEWKNATFFQKSDLACINHRRCPFAWFAEYNRDDLSTHVVQSAGWDLVSDKRNSGLATTGGLHSVLVLDFHEPSITSTIIIMALKSYGEKWMNSTTLVSAFKKRKGSSELINSLEISGSHQSKTSVGFTSFLSLKNSFQTENSTLRLEIKLIGGSNAKILGLAICS